ncbi:hypothetical protein F4678DRAFT_465407 [Xylaria arbuscula]|nr:hypothetical protein F4678DRAFT_465407 [Xylaria arbuscula]
MFQELFNYEKDVLSWVFTPRPLLPSQRANDVLEIELDAIVVDENSQRLAPRTIGKLKPSSRVLGIGPSEHPLVFVEGQFNWFVDGKLFRTISTPDRVAVDRQLSDPPVSEALPKHATAAETEQRTAPNKAAAIYRAYIQSFNDRTMVERFGKFVRPQITFNGSVITLDGYRQGLDSLIAAMPVHFATVHTFTADDKAGLLVSQLESSGTLVKPFAGREATNSPVLVC